MQSLFGLILFFAPQITDRSLSDWFFPRLIVGIGAGIATGLAAALFHLNKLKRNVTGARPLDVERQARKWLAFYTLLFLFVVDSGLFLDISFSSFTSFGLPKWKDIFLSSYSFIIQGSSLIGFLAAATLATRFGKNSNCKYAVIPW